MSESGCPTIVVPPCECEANVFYKKYQDKIGSILDQYMSDQEKLLEQKRFADRKKSSSTAKAKRRQTRDKKDDFKDGVQDSSKDADAEGSAGMTSELEVSEGTDQMVDAEESLYKTSVKSLGSYKGEEDVGAAYVKDAQDEHVEFFSSALDAKLHHIFSLSGGEEQSELHTERGYYIFDRYTEHTAGSSVVKMHSMSLTSGEEAHEGFPYVPVTAGEWMSDSMRKALDYLKRHHIGDLFKFMGAHLVSSNPCNPIDFLINLLDNCLNYRMGYSEPPLLYMPKHIESLFMSMDPMNTGFIEMNQYHTGMLTLGIKEYNMFPMTVNFMVSKLTFINEAYNRLKFQLNDMIQSFEIPVTVSSITTPHYPPDKGECECDGCVC